MSAIGSEMFIGLPARLRDAGQLALEGALPEADPARGEPPHVGPRAAADEAAVVGTDLELRRSVRLRDHRLLGHGLLPLATTRRACRGAPADACSPRRSSPSSRC